MSSMLLAQRSTESSIFFRGTHLYGSTVQVRDDAEIIIIEFDQSSLWPVIECPGRRIKIYRGVWVEVISRFYGGVFSDSHTMY